MVLDRGGLGQHLVAVEARPGLVRAQHVGHGHGVGGGLDPGQVERGDVGGVVEHLCELTREQVQLLLGQVQAGQGGHVGDVLAGEAAGPGHHADVPPTPPSTAAAKATTRASISGASLSSVATW